MLLALAVVFVLLVAFIFRSCRSERASPGGAGDLYVPPDSGGAPTSFSGLASPSGGVSEADFMDIPVLMTERITQDSVEGVAVGRLNPDGTSYLVAGTDLRGTRRSLGFRVYDLEGGFLWEHLFTGASYRTTQAGYQAGGRYIVASAVTYGEAGVVMVLEANGAHVFERSFDGWAEAVLSDDGKWLALFNHRRRTLEVLGPRRYSPAWSANVGSGAWGLFTPAGDGLLVCEAGRARMFDQRGQLMWSQDIPDGGRWNAAFSPDGRFLAATTEDPDSSVYLYSVTDGSLVWKQFLVTGGNKHTAFSPNGRLLVVYDVGKHAAIYMLDAATGEIPWRFYLRGREDATLAVADLDFAPSGDYMIADIVESTVAEDAYHYYHYLLRLTIDGRALWVSPLGGEADVDIDVRHGLALITSNNPLDAYGNVENTITLLRFQTDAPPAGGS